MSSSCRAAARPLCAGVLLAIGCLTLSAAVAAAADVSIAPSVAGLFIGEEKVVEGVVSSAERDGNTVRLHVGTPPQELLVSLVVGMLSNYPPEPERYYAGKTVRVIGTIRSFRGTAEIVIHDAASIQILGAAPPASRPLAASPIAGPAPAPATSTEQRLDALGERLRLLENRVQQLEQVPHRQEGH